MSWPTVIASGVVAALIGLATYDVIRRRHTILRTFPLIGHLRFLLEAVGPELRQYIVTNNDEERPFSRDQRRWIYTSAKRTSTYFGFGTDKDLELASNYLILDQAAFPLPRPAADDDWLPCAKVVGAARGRSAAFRPASRVNISAMSYGSLSGRAIEAINRGCAAAGCLHNTGEGGLSPYHLHGGDLCSRSAPATSDVGARTAGSAWSAWLSWSLPTRSRQLRSSSARVRSPGWVGVLAAAKVSPEIAAIRGVPVGRDCVSPSAHTAFSDADSLLDVVEDIAQATGLPVGIKSAVGETAFWDNLVRLMRDTGRGVDFVTIDGGEGGTGAAPLAFSDHVALPFKLALSRVYRRFAAAGLADDVVFIGSGKLGLPENALLAVALGCDLINVAREAKLAVDCIQSLRCHTGHCPAGVATQSRWLARGLDPADKAARLAAYLCNLRHELLQLAHACGVEHPALVGSDRFEILDGRYGATRATELFGYQVGWGLPTLEAAEELRPLMARQSMQLPA